MSTHITGIKGKYDVQTSAPSAPKDGDMYFDTTLGSLGKYDATEDAWFYHVYTSTSSSSTSSSTTSTSSSTTTSTTTSSSTSTTSTSTSL